MDLSAFRNLFGDLQEHVVGILNQDEIIDAMGAKFVSENALDIEYEVKDALAKTGMACVVMTPTATYQGHNGIQQTFTCDELTLQIVENPVVHRPWLKKNNLAYGTGLDVAKAASDRLAGPQGGHFGQFTTKRIREAEQSGLLVVTATFGCTVYETLSAVPSGDISGNWVEVPFVRMSELSDWIDDYLSTHMPVPEVSGYLPLSGGMMTGAISAYSNATIIDWGYDGSLAAGTPGVDIRTAGEDGYYRFPSQDGVVGPSEYDVMRRKDLPSVDVPTKLSELSNDVGYTTDEDVYDIMQPVQDSITALSADMKGYIPLSVDSPVAAKITGGNTAGWEFNDQNGTPLFKIDEYGTYFSKRADIYGELYYKNQALSDYIDGKLPSVPDKLSQLSNDVGYITNAALSDYLPLSGGTMDNGATIVFFNEQENQSLMLDGQNGNIISRGGALNDFNGFSFDGVQKYSLDDQARSFTPQTPAAESKTIMRGGDIYAVIGDISALIHAT